MSWRENKPAATDIPNEELAELFQSQKTHVSAYLSKHFYWAENSGASAGMPRLSNGSPGPGSAHAFYGAASQVSAVSAGGKLMVTSDTSRFYGLHSTQSTLLGSPRAIVSCGASAATLPSNTRWLIQSGVTSATVDSVAAQSFSIVFPIAYTAVAPFVELTPTASIFTQRTTSHVSGVPTVSGVSIVVTTSVTGTAGVHWRSVGTVSL